MKIFHISCEESFLMQRTELPCGRLLSWTAHIRVFCCRSIEHVFCLLLSALEWVNLEQMNSCLLFLNAGSNDALCMNKGKTWSQVITPRNMFSVSFLKGWNLRVFLTRSLWPNHRIAQSYYSTQPFTKCSGVEQYRIAGLVPDSCST